MQFKFVGFFCDLWNRNFQALDRISEYLTTAQMRFFVFRKKSEGKELIGCVGKIRLSCRHFYYLFKIIKLFKLY